MWINLENIMLSEISQRKLIDLNVNLSSNLRILATVLCSEIQD